MPLHNWGGFLGMLVIGFITKRKSLIWALGAMLGVVGITTLAAPLYHIWYKTIH